MGTPDLAQHFTPPCAVDLAYDLLQRLHGPLESPRIIDPACGQGIFLRRALDRRLTSPGRAFGIERDASLALDCLGEPSGPRAAVADALLGLRAPLTPGAFDLVVANPPYGTGAAGLRQLPDPAAERILSAYGLRALRSPSAERLRSYPAEILFLELCISLARSGGHVAILLPEGVFANGRYRRAREWLLSSFRLDAVIGLPKDTFRRTGAAAKTALLLLTKRRAASDHQVLLGEVLSWDEPTCSPDGLHFSTRRRQSDAGLRRRLDPSYWHPDHEALLSASREPLAPLEGFIGELTYGPIVTGQKPMPTESGVSLVNQGQVRFCGVDLTEAPRVAEDSPWIANRSMLQPGDVVLPRSGEGSLGKHRVAVFLSDEPAGVGSFVDLIRLSGLNPFYLSAFLKSRLGRGQVSRVANGVGVPNISFDEIRALRIPRLSASRQQAVERRYRAEVLPHHERAVARHRTLRASGRAASSDATYTRHLEAGEGAWRAIIDSLDSELLPPNPL